jgi:hypothetical protein
LERGELESIADGPYLEGYYRAYCEAVGLKPAGLGPLANSQVPERGGRPLVPLKMVRFLAFMGMGALGLFGAWQWMEKEVQSLSEPGASSGHLGATTTPQTVRLRVRKTGHFEVIVGGVLVQDGRLEEGTTREYASYDKIEILVPGAGSVTLDHNGRAIVPQGLQDTPRRLTFVDDAVKDH